jgi:thiol-disulfide isomerase/thioredoxin
MKKLALFFLLLAFVKFSHAQTSLDTAVNFTVNDVNNNTHRLFDYLDQGKIVVIDFFTVTCGPCADYAPEISESYRHYGCNSGNVVILGINWGADNSQVAEFGQTNGAIYPEVSGTEGNGDHVVADFGILSYPSVILVLPDRFIAEQYIWPPSTSHLDSLIALHGGAPMDCSTGVQDLIPTLDPSWIRSIYPNPARESCMVTFHESANPVIMRLLTSTGKEVLRFDMLKLPENEKSLRIDLSSQSPGYYLLQILSGNCIHESHPLIRL